MKALHLPGVPPSESPPYTFPSNPTPPSVLQYHTSYPDPAIPSNPQTHTYLISVTATALTRGELTWLEILERSRFHEHGGAIPGHDVVGTVEHVYPSTNSSHPPKFSTGDKIWGLIDFDRDGAAASKTVVYETEIALLPAAPDGVSMKAWDRQMSTLPLSALTAYQALFEHGGLDPRHLLSGPEISTSTRPRILILGPTGSVGLPTLYLCLAAGFPTVVYTSSKHIDFLTSLTSSSTSTSTSLPSPAKPHDSLLTIILNDSPDFISLPTSFTSTPAFTTKPIQPVSLLLDTIGPSTITSLLLSTNTNTTPSLSSLLPPKGKIISIVAPLETLLPDPHDLELATQNLKACGLTFEFFIVKPDSKQMEVLGELVGQGKLVGCVDGVYELGEGRVAMELVERKGRGGRGKVVLDLVDE